MRAAGREERRSRMGNAAGAVVIACLAVWAVYAAHGEDPLNVEGTPNRLRNMLITSAPCALSAHMFIQRWMSAALVSGVAFSVLCHIFGLVPPRRAEHALFISFPAGALYGTAVAALVAVPFILLRRAPGPRRWEGPDSEPPPPSGPDPW